MYRLIRDFLGRDEQSTEPDVQDNLETSTTSIDQMQEDGQQMSDNFQEGLDNEDSIETITNETVQVTVSNVTESESITGADSSSPPSSSPRFSAAPVFTVQNPEIPPASIISPTITPIISPSITSTQLVSPPAKSPTTSTPPRMPNPSDLPIPFFRPDSSDSLNAPNQSNLLNIINPSAYLQPSYSTNSMSSTTSVTMTSSSGTPQEPGSPPYPPPLALRADPTLNIDRASTESLKLALFGPQRMEMENEKKDEGTGSETTQTRVQDVHSLDYLNFTSNPVSTPASTSTLASSSTFASTSALTYATTTIDAIEPNAVAVAEEPTPDAVLSDDSVEVVDYNKLTTLESIPPTSTLLSTTKASSSSGNSLFTYQNPFNVFKKAAATTTARSKGGGSAPGQSQKADGSMDKNVSVKTEGQSVGQKAKMSSEGAAMFGEKPIADYSHMEPSLPDTTAWNIRASMTRKNLSGDIPDGMRLPSNDIVIDMLQQNESMISTRDLELTTITRVIRSDTDYRTSKLIAANDHFICYAVKGGKVRIISIQYGSKALVRLQGTQIIDVCLQYSSHNNCHFLLAIDDVSTVTIWEISEPPQTVDEEIPCKVVFELDAKTMASEPRPPRYTRAVWHPNRTVFAVATDTNEVGIIDVAKVSEGKNGVTHKEEEIWSNVAKTEKYDEPVEDLAFSSDGTILATASGHYVKFFDVQQLTSNPHEAVVVHSINLHGERPSSILFVDLQEGLSLFNKSSVFDYIIIGANRNSVLRLYDATMESAIQEIKYIPPKEETRDGRSGKALTNERKMFNCVAFEQKSRCLIVGNSVRMSIFAVHLDTSKKKFDYIIEFPVDQFIISFVNVPESDGFSVYCIQTDAVQQYRLYPEMLYPNSLERCPEFKCEPIIFMQKKTDDKTDKGAVEVISSEGAEPKVKAAEIDKEQSVTESVRALTAGSQTKDTNTIPENTLPQPIKQPLSASPATVTHDQSSLHPPHPPASTSATTSATASTSTYTESHSSIVRAVSESQPADEEDKKDNQKAVSTGNIKLSGPVVNGTIARLKEKKKAEKERALAAAGTGEIVSDSERPTRRKDRHREKDKDKEKDKDSNNDAHPEPSQKNKKPADVQKLNGKSSNANEKSRKTEAQAQQESSNHKADGNTSKEFRKLEENIVNKVQKVFIKEMDKQSQELKSDRIQHQAHETARQQSILKVVSETLNNNTSQLMTQTIRHEVETMLVPALTRTLTSTVDNKVKQALPEAISKSIPVAIERAVSENVSKVLSKPAVIESIAKGVSKAMRPTVDEIFKQSFTGILVPQLQEATAVMFSQINQTVEEGLQHVAERSEKSLTSIGAGEKGIKDVHGRLEQLERCIRDLQQTQVELLNTIKGMQQQRQQELPQQQLPSSIHPQPLTTATTATTTHLPSHMPETHSSHATAEVQHKLARSLSGELKRMLIPQTTPRLGRMSTQDGYEMGNKGVGNGALQPTGIITSIGAGTPVNNVPISLPTAAAPMATATMASIPTTATIPLSTATTIPQPTTSIIPQPTASIIPQPTASIIPQSTNTFNTSNTSLITRQALPSQAEHTIVHHRQQTHQRHPSVQRPYTSPMEAPGVVELRNMIDRYLDMGNFEEAFVKALSSNDATTILRLISKLDPKTIFHEDGRTSVSQLVVLSLIHHLSNELDKLFELKLLWLEEAVAHLDVKDTSIREHLPQIIPPVRQRLEDTYYRQLAEDTAHPSLKRFAMLIYRMSSFI